MLDAVSDPRVSDVVVMSSAQVGKTTIMKAVIGYFVDQDPAPMLCLQPTVEMAQTFSKDRLAPMVRDTPALHGKIADPKSRSSGNTVLHKRFPGGHITMAGANSPASLASRPIRVVLLDETSRYPESAGSEGDPVSLARKRATTFWNRKIVETSTPTDKGCRIEQSFDRSDQRYFHVPCSHCDHEQVLKWESVKWPEGEPDKAQIACKQCGVLWSESDRIRAIVRGEWKASAPFRGIAGFHINEIYSPWSTPAAMANAFLEAKHGGPEQLKTWVNTALGESWEEEGESVDEHLLMARREDFGDLIPKSVLALTMGVDVQRDRLEYEVVGWDEQQESWSIEYQILPGDPTDGDVWANLAEVISGRHKTADGRMLSIVATCVDSGYLPKNVYEFCGSQGMHVLPVKGVPGKRPVVETGIQRMRRLRRRQRDGVKPEIIGVDEAKLILHRRLHIERPGPGYCHFPSERDDEYFAQLTAEKLVTRFSKGRPILEWIQMRPRNEALDCRVYAHAALLLHGIDKIKQPVRASGVNLPRRVGLA